jgi:hypothetical protein
MKRPMILMLVLLGVAMIAPAWAGAPSASKAVAGEEAGLTTLAITVSSDTDEVYAVTIVGASMEDIRAPKGWVGIASGSTVTFRTGDNPVKRGNSLAFRLVTPEASAGLTVSFRGKDDPVGKPMSL